MANKKKEGEPASNNPIQDQFEGDEDYVNKDQRESDQEDQSDNESEDTSVHYLVKEMPQRSKFLTQVGIYFVIYFSFLVAACLFIYFVRDRAKIFYRRFYLETYIWLIIALFSGLKIVLGFFGKRLKIFLHILFFADILLGMLFIEAIFFYVDNDVSNKFTNNSPKVIIITFNLFGSVVAYLLSTLVRSSNNTYNVMIGILITTATNSAIITSFIYGWKSLVTIPLPQYFGILAIMIIFNTYLCINSYLVVRYRTRKFYDNEGLACFYGYWVDWACAFWIDAFKSSRYIRNKVRERRRLEREQKEEARKKKMPNIKPNAYKADEENPGNNESKRNAVAKSKKKIVSNKRNL
jgi:hypothetical protein